MSMFVFLFLVTCKSFVDHAALSTVAVLCLFYAYFNVLFICLQNIWILWTFTRT